MADMLIDDEKALAALEEVCFRVCFFSFSQMLLYSKYLNAKYLDSFEGLPVVASILIIEIVR